MEAGNGVSGGVRFLRRIHGASSRLIGRKDDREEKAITSD